MCEGRERICLVYKKITRLFVCGLLITYVSDHLAVFALCNYIDYDLAKEKCFV